MVSQRPGGVNEKGKQIVTEGKKLAVVSTSRKGGMSRVAANKRQRLPGQVALPIRA
jgi:hypothetical protein